VEGNGVTHSIYKPAICLEAVSKKEKPQSGNSVSHWTAEKKKKLAKTNVK